MNEGLPLRAVVMAEPGPAWAGVSDLPAHNMSEAPDPGRTARQHRDLVRTVGAGGADVVVLDEPPDQPNATFTRDVALVTDAGYVRLRMGLPARRGEPGWMAAVLDARGVPLLGRIEAPGTVEGGDVILAGEVAFVGRSGRTNAEGIRQLTALLEPLGHRVRVAAVPAPHLHLGGLMSLVAPRRVVARAGALEPSFLEGFEVVELSGPAGANVICLGPEEVVADASEGPGTADVLERRGIRVHALDLSEFRKGNGGPTCLILPLERG